MTTIRVNLDRPGGFPVGCEGCPLAHTDDSLDRWSCSAIVDEQDGRRFYRVIPDAIYAPAPAWCPLRSGPVTVEAAT